MTEYVLVYAQNVNAPEALALLVLKDKPAWQVGRYNLPGGKIEAGETPAQAASRELYEETGYNHIGEMKVLGKIADSDCIIHCCKAVVMAFHEPRPQEGETQGVSWLYWDDVRNDPRLIPNLRVIIPLLRCDVEGWTITDDYRSSESAYHGVSIQLPTFHLGAAQVSE